MDNPVVIRVAEVAESLGIATLRFNFRGVGASTGNQGGGGAEEDDVRTARAAMAERLGIDLSSLRTVKDFRQVLPTVLAAVARGEIAPAEAARIARQVPTRLRAVRAPRTIHAPAGA